MRRPLVSLLSCLVALTLTGSACSGARPSLAAATAPTTTVDAAKVATLDPNASGTSVVATAIVAKVDVFDTPDAAKPKATLAHPTADGAPLVFLVEGFRSGWLQVLLPMRPNGSMGWVRSADVKLSRHTYHIEVRLSEFRIKVTRGAEVVLDAPIGVAKENTPTPGGKYYTTELLKPPQANSVYGTYAYGLSGFSEVLQSFNGGPGQIGIHGTNDPSSIGKRVSSGCIRLRNDDIDKLAAILPLGVPVEIIV